MSEQNTADSPSVKRPAAQLPNNLIPGDFYGSSNEELFTYGPFATRDECVAEMLASGEEYPLWTATPVPYRPRIHPYWVLDHIGEDDDLHPDLGESLYHEVQSAGDAAWGEFGKRLTTLVLEWLDEHTSLPFKVADVQEHREQLEGGSSNE